MKSPDHDLGSQQNKLATVQYDLRITNLASFLYSKLHSCHPELVSGSQQKTGSRIAPETSRLVRDGIHSPLASQGKQLLDVGAGNGLFLKFFKSQGFSVRGYELEAELVQNMKKDPELAGVRIEQGDITKLKGKEEYDIVIASDVIEHIEDDVQAIRGLWSFVAPGGVLLITVPGHSYLYGKRDVMWGHFRRYDQTVLLERIEKAISQGKTYEVVFATQWNTVGFFVYGFFEKILHKPINEKMRYSNSLPSRFTRFILDRILKVEEKMGGVPLGLTQVVGVKKIR